MAIYSIYIQNYMTYSNSGRDTYHTTKTLVYQIPITNPDYAFIDPVVKTEMGKAGSMEFSVLPNHPYYNCWAQMKTLVWVEMGNDVLFRGRVLTIDLSPFDGTKKIHCEGDLAFLMDSLQELTHEADRSEISCEDYLENLIDAHNDQVDSYKKIYLGQVPGKYSSGIHSAQKLDPPDKKYGSGSWETTMDALEELTSDYGGYLRTRWTNGYCYLDWLDCFFDRNQHTESIALGKNLIELNCTTEVENIFTVLVPVGSKNSDEIYIDGYGYSGSSTWSGKYITVPDLVRLADEGVIDSSDLSLGYHTREDYATSVARYGYIYKTQKFENANTQAKLFEYATDWMLHNYMGGLTSFSVTALDLHHLNPNVYTRKYMVGDQVEIEYPDPMRGVDGNSPLVSQMLTIMSMEYNLHNPEKNSYTIGIPNQTISKTYGTASSSSSSSSKDPDENKDPLTSAQEKLGEVDSTLWDIVWNAYYNNDQYSAYDADGVESIIMSQYVFLQKATSSGSYEQVMLDGMNGKINISEYTQSHPEYPYVESLMTSYYGSGIKFLAGATSSTPGTTVAQIIGGSVGAGEFDASKMLLGQDGAGNGVAISLDGLTGLFSMFGLDSSTGNFFESINIDSFQQFLKFFKKPEAGDDPDNPTVTAEVNGEDGTAGFGGTRETGTGNPKFDVTLSKPVTYTGSDGHTYTIEGCVAAKDFHLASVPSFVSEFAYIDTVVVRDLYAAKGSIDALTASDISATKINTDKIGAKRMYAGDMTLTTSYGDGAITAYDYKLHFPGSGELVHLGDCFSSAEFHAGDGSSSYPDSGKIYLRLLRVGSGEQIINFNMAATQYYIDAVAAANSDGWTGCRNTIKLNWSTTQTLDPGGSRTVQAMCKATPSATEWSTISNDYTTSVTIQARNLRLRTPATAVKPSTSSQTITPGSDSGGTPYDGLAKVVVAAAALENAGTITPTTTNQTITPSGSNIGLSKVVVKGSSNLVAENIKYGKTIFGVEGSLQLRDGGTITPNTGDQTIEPGTGYWGLSQVKVKGSSNLTAENIKSGVSIFGVSGTYSGSGGGNFTGDDVELVGPTDATVLNSRPTTNSYPIDKGMTSVSGTVWGKMASDGKWHNLRTFSISVPAWAVTELYNKPVGGSYTRLNPHRLYYFEESN